MLRDHRVPPGRGTVALQSCPSTRAAAPGHPRRSGPMDLASGDGLLRKLRGGSSWQRNGERAAAARLALDAYAAVVRRCDELHDAQSESAAAAFAREGLIDLVEGLKNSAPVARRDADPVVLHGKLHGAVFCPHVKHDVLDLFRILVG